jgi:hypothetical protein
MGGHAIARTQIAVLGFLGDIGRDQRQDGWRLGDQLRCLSSAQIRNVADFIGVPIEPHVMLSRPLRHAATVLAQPWQPLAVLVELCLYLDQQAAAGDRVVETLLDGAPARVMLDLDACGQIGERIRALDGGGVGHYVPSFNAALRG